MARPRNNIMKLVAETRLHICELLDDGATYDGIRDDELVAAECAEKELTLHNRSFLAYRNGTEFNEYCLRRREWSDSLERNKIAATLVQSGDGSDDIARLISYKLLQTCLDKLNDGEDLTDKEVRAISGALGGYNRNRIAEEKEDTRREFDEKKAEYQVKIAQLSATIEMMSNRDKNVNTTKVAEDLDAALGVR